MTKEYYLKDKDELVISGKQIREYKKIVVSETLNINPEDFFIRKVVKSGNGASISFKKEHIGKEVYVILKTHHEKDVLSEKRD